MNQVNSETMDNHKKSAAESLKTSELATLRDNEYSTEANQINWANKEMSPLKMYISRIRTTFTPSDAELTVDAIAKASVVETIQARKRVHDKDTRKIIPIIDLSDDE